MAGAAIIFGRYFCELFGLSISEQVVATLALAILTAINCLGVRAGSNVQNALMLIKLLAIGVLIGVGCFGPVANRPTAVELSTNSGGLAGLARAMAPVLFAYGGWQTASFISGEMRNPRRDLPRGLLFGVIGVILCYVLVSYSCVRVLGVADLAHTNVPASEVMRHAFGDRGGRLIAAGIAISTLGFLSQSILTAPRVYYAMARDRVFFKGVGYLDPRTRVPTVAIVLQGVCAAAIALTGKYDQILNYVVSIDVLFFGLTGASLLIFRARLKRETSEEGRLRVPGHPITTGIFVLACWAISISTVVQFPRNAGIGVAILVAGALIYPLWRSDVQGAAPPPQNSSSSPDVPT
jgi:APA family basic amino acid/polyamine antiporter